jgi:hypothetical protein
MDRAGVLSLSAFNDESTWKHAWRGALDGWFAVGVISVGDVIAYRTTELSSSDPPLWMLDAFEMTPSALSASLGGLFDAIGRWSREPDDLVASVRERIPTLDDGSLVAFAPPPIAFGVEGLAGRAQPMSARLVMTFNGDAHAEAARCRGRTVERLDTYEDEQRRLRLRFVPT